MGFVAPLTELLQFEGERTHVSCRIKPEVLGAHEIVACPGPTGTIVSVGAVATCTTVGKAQKAPVMEYFPLVIGPPASGWPIVPLTEYTPPVLVPPPNLAQSVSTQLPSTSKNVWRQVPRATSSWSLCLLVFDPRGGTLVPALCRVSAAWPPSVLCSIPHSLPALKRSLAVTSISSWTNGQTESVTLAYVCHV